MSWVGMLLRGRQTDKPQFGGGLIEESDTGMSHCRLDRFAAACQLVNNHVVADQHRDQVSVAGNGAKR